MKTAKIVMSNHGQGDIYLDGEKLDHCVGFSLACCVGQTNRLTIELNVSQVTYEGVVSPVDGESKDNIFLERSNG